MHPSRHLAVTILIVMTACGKRHKEAPLPAVAPDVTDVAGVVSGAQPTGNASVGGGTVSALPPGTLTKIAAASTAPSTTEAPASTTWPLEPPPSTTPSPALHADAGADAILRSARPLAGSVSGTLANVVTTSWEKLSGPGAVLFDDATNAAATPTFAADGVYILRLTAISADLTAADEVQITWDTTPPTVSTGPNLRARNAAVLSGSVTDATATTAVWTQESGPGTCTVLAAASPQTSVTCDVDGTYTLRLTATDTAGNRSSSDVNLDWDAHAPVVFAGAAIDDAVAPITLAATATDSAPMTYSWRKVSGPGAVDFSDSTALNPTASATAEGLYVLLLTATDSFGNSAASELRFHWSKFDTTLTFLDTTRYAYDSSHIAVINGVASLRTVPLTDPFDTEADFHAAGAGLSRVAWNNAAGGLALDAAGLAAQSGLYQSPALDLHGPADVKSLRWANEIPGPYQRGLPANGASDPSAWGPAGVTAMSDLVFLFHFDEDAGSRSLTDSSGLLAAGGQPARATCTGSGCPKLNYRGRIGRGAEFDGVDDFLTIPDAPSNRVDGSLSIAVWMKVEDVGFNYIIEKGDSDACDNYAMYMYGGQAGFEMSQGFNGPGTCNGTWAGWNETASPLATGAWYHLAVVYDDAEHSITFYRNGIQSGRFTNLSERITPSDRPVRIGRQWWGGTPANAGFFHGGMDELGVWKKALTAAEIEKFYARGRYRLDLQVRGCQDAACATATAWLGPDGGANSAFYTYYLPDGRPVAELPVVGIEQQNFVQFRATFSAPDTVTSPVLASVGAAAFDTGNPTITLMDPIRSFTTLSSFAEVVDSDHIGDVKYQVSADGSDWRFHDGTAWVPASNSLAQANSAADINAHVASIAAACGTGTFRFRAFLNRNPGAGFIRLRGIRVTGTATH